jgi:hypothetical protein
MAETRSSPLPLPASSPEASSADAGQSSARYVLVSVQLKLVGWCWFAVAPPQSPIAISVLFLNFFRLLLLFQTSKWIYWSYHFRTRNALSFPAPETASGVSHGDSASCRSSCLFFADGHLLSTRTSQATQERSGSVWQYCSRCSQPPVSILLISLFPMFVFFTIVGIAQNFARFVSLEGEFKESA